jgi:ech hydrogenase subunit F
VGVFKLGGMTLKSLFTKAPTRRYPYEKREPFERSRGHIDMIDIHDCIFCGMCQRKCPADAIVVDRKASKWTYWPYKCVACDSCVRACPKSDLEMLQARPETTDDVSKTVVYALTAEEIAEKERLAAEKKAKILAAQKAKMQAAAKKGADKDGKGGSDKEKE